MCYTILPVIYTFQRLSYDPTFVNQSTFNNPVFWLYVTFSSIFLFYANTEFLIPVFFKKKRTVEYFILLSILISILIVIRILLRYFITTPGGRELSYYFYFNALIPYLFIFAISTSHRFFKDYQTEQKIQAEKENEQLKTELSFLRSQISPHFMFNLMNSMVSLARKKSDLLEPMLIKMSELLRYMLYERADSKISLEQESSYLRNYIDLQLLRFGKKVVVNFEENLTKNDLQIEPMLLIPFVENAFKHGTGLIKEPKINIKLSNDNNKIAFYVENQCCPSPAATKDMSSGIGLSNVKRRLALLYPNHQLEIQTNDNHFIINLQIEL